jgi:tRNA(fMet)-specific endonuclease VapC
MSGRFLLDTNVIIALFGGEAALENELGQADEVFVPAIVLGELYFGARKSGRVEENLARIDEFALISPVLACDAGTAKEFGVVKNELRRRGRPIPDNDLWIAAIARQCQLTLVTRDTHFEEIDGLKVAVW